MDIIVTTPKSEMLNAQQEAKDCIKAGGGVYFRRLSSRPIKLEIGDRVFYVEDGYVRGFAEVSEIELFHSGAICETTHQTYPPGWYVMMDAVTWKWIEPIKMKGFQGYRYCNFPKIEIVGGWLDPKPKTKL